MRRLDPKSALISVSLVCQEHTKVSCGTQQVAARRALQMQPTSGAKQLGK